MSAKAKAGIIVGFHHGKRINSALDNLPPSVCEQQMGRCHNNNNCKDSERRSHHNALYDMSNQIHSKRFVTFLIILLLTGYPLLFSATFSVTGLAKWMVEGFSLNHIQWLLLCPPIAWFFWFRLSRAWIYNRPAHPGTPCLGSFFGILSLFLFGYGALAVLPAILFACYLVYWYLNSAFSP